MRRLVLAALALWFLPDAGFPQVKFFENGQPTRTGSDAGMFCDSPTRLKVDLSGSWRYSTDGKNWNSVSIPAAYDGTSRMTLMRTFTISSEMLDKYSFSLVVYGINYQSEITVNGNFVGRHMGGYSSFVLPVQQNVLQVGTENAIVISVDNELTPKTTLPLRQQVGTWRSYGGIFRDIYLLATPRFFIDKIDAQSSVSGEGKSGTINVRAELSDRYSNLKTESGSLLGFQFEVYDKLTTDFVGRSGISPFIPQVNKSVGVNAQAVIGSPKIWSPEMPDLYVVKCQIVRLVSKEISVLDEFSFDTGLRDLRWKDARLYVNGEVMPINGVLWHEDQVNYGSALTYEAMERDVASIKALGANCIRFVYPPHPYMLNLCDRYGLFAMEEIPVVNVPTEILTKDYFQDVAINYVKEMVVRDKSHVSVLAWGVGDEFETSSNAACEYVNSARNIIKSLDNRLVYFATRTPFDRCLEYVDLLAINNYQDDVKSFHELLKECQSKYPDKPIIVARYGKNVEPGNRNGYSDPRSMESQGRYVMQYFEAIKETKIAGSILWAFNDWRSDRPSLTTNAGDPYLVSMGLVSYEREKRVAFEVTRAMFNGEKVQALPIGNYSSSAPIVYVFAGLIVLVAFAFFYNGNRRFRDCINRSMFRTYNFFADVRDQRILAYSHSAFLALIISITWATILSSIFTHYRQSLLLDNILSQIMSDGTKEWFIKLIWSPTKFIAVMSGLILIKLLLVTVFVKLFSMLVRTHVYFYHAFSISMWSMLPYVILIPLSMILYRLMESEVYTIPVFVVLLLITVWVVLRLFKGISIIYDVYPIKVYASGVLFIVVCTAMLYGYLDYTQSTSMYLKYLLQSVRTSM